MDVPLPPSFSLALLTNSSLSELECAWNSCKSLSAKLLLLEQFATFEKIKAIIMFRFDVKDDVNVNNKATVERLASTSFDVKSMQAYSYVDCLFTLS